MKKLFTKLTMLLIAITMSTSMMAQLYSGGDGTSGDPYQITTTDDLIFLSQFESQWGVQYFIQTSESHELKIYQIKQSYNQ